MNRFAIPVDDQITVPKQGRVTFIKGYDGQVSRSRNEGKKHGTKEQQPHVKAPHYCGSWEWYFEIYKEWCKEGR